MDSRTKYDSIAKFYDDVIGRSFDSNTFIMDVLEEYGSDVKNVLELGCGTGSILKDLSGKYNVTGIDISKEMIKIASKKVRKGKFIQADIRRFKIDKKFEAVICIYDTINHLTSFSDWEKVFKNAYDHLNDKGIFLFDINTTNKLEYLAFIKTYFYTFRNNYLVVNVKKLKQSVYNWELNVFEHVKGDTYKLYREQVPEAVFKIKDIKEGLKPFFKIKKLFTDSLDKVSDNADRVYFVCQKR